MMNKGPCDKAPAGWHCSLQKGHEGACAAWPVSHEAAAAFDQTEHVELPIGKTFDDDYVQLKTIGQPTRLTCKSLGFSWPPPEEINVLGLQCTRLRYSAITDEQREGLTHICRGAEYEVHRKAEDLGDAS